MSYQRCGGPPVSLDGYVPTTQKAAANGVATLGSDSKVPSSQLDVVSLATKGDIAVETATGLVAQHVSGTDGNVLTEDSTSPTGLSYKPQSAVAIPPYADPGMDASTLAYMKWNDLWSGTSYKNEVTGTLDFSVARGAPAAACIGPQGQPGAIGGIGASIWLPSATSAVEVVSANGAFQPSGSALTVSVWMRIVGLPAGDARLLSKVNGGGWSFLLVRTSSNLLVFGVQTSAGTVWHSVGAYVLPMHEWVMWTGVYDGAHIRQYMNGTEVGVSVAQTGTLVWPAAAPWTLGDVAGSTGLGADWYAGPLWIDGVARSSAYIRSLYNKGAKRY